jgi:hypothetical protein
MLEDEMNNGPDSRLDVIDLASRFDVVVKDNVPSQAANKHETTKTELKAANMNVSKMELQKDQLQWVQAEKDEKFKELLLESNVTLLNYKGQVQRQECELAILRADRIKLQGQVEEQRSLLWKLEEANNFYRLRWMRFSNSIGRSNETDQDEMKYDATVEQCKSSAAIESLRRKNRHFEKLNATLFDELTKKNGIICKMSCSNSFAEVSAILTEELERSLNIATERSVAYAESQMKVDKLTEAINRLKLNNTQRAADTQEKFQCVGKSKSFQSDQTTTSKLDGIKSLSSIFSRSFNASSSGMDTSYNASNVGKHSVKADLLSLSIPRIDFSIRCGNTSGVVISKTPTASKNTKVPIESCCSTEKDTHRTSFTDHDDASSGASKLDFFSSPKDKRVEPYDASDDLLNASQPKIFLI